jgi:hypothetical protein
MLKEDLFVHLNSDETLLLDGRIYPQIAVDNPILPFLVFTVVNELDEKSRSLSRGVSSRSYRMQIDCYDSTALKAERLKNRVKKSLYNFKHCPRQLSARDAYVENVKFFGQILDFKLNISGENCE